MEKGEKKGGFSIHAHCIEKYHEYSRKVTWSNGPNMGFSSEQCTFRMNEHVIHIRPADASGAINTDSTPVDFYVRLEADNRDALIKLHKYLPLYGHAACPRKTGAPCAT